MTDEPRDRRGLPNTQRVDPPRYLATYLDRQKTQDPTEGDSDESLPLYLRRFRQRQGEDRQGPTSLPLEQRDIRPNIGHGMQKEMSEDNRTK
jgi:hypothetical protein